MATVTITVPDGVPARYVNAVCASEPDRCAGLTAAQRAQRGRARLYRHLRETVLGVEAAAAADALWTSSNDALNAGEGQA